MTVAPYDPRYAGALREICIQTSGHSPEDAAYIQAMYCNNYLENETVFVLLDGGTPMGYILCAESYDAYARHMKPYLQKIRPMGFIKWIMARAEMAFYRARRTEYPAHLHIDILESHTGSGSGTLLMNTLLTHLKRRGIPGVMLMVNAKNHRAIRFYEKMGFSPLARNRMAITYGKKL